MTDPISAFYKERAETVAAYPQDKNWMTSSNEWMRQAFAKRYMYNFDVLGRPIIQLPSDSFGVQELIWETRPDLVIETGIAHGGSLILSAASLALLDYCDAAEKGETLDPRKPKRRVLGIDIDIRAHNRAAIEKHPLAGRIDMIEGSCLSNDIFSQVKERAQKVERVLIFLDSNHTHDHVLAELELYAPLTSKGSYCVVFDTIVEDLPEESSANRPWGPGNSPKTAVHAYLDKLKNEGRTASDGQPLHMEVDTQRHLRLALTNAPDGFLKRV